MDNDLVKNIILAAVGGLLTIFIGLIGFFLHDLVQQIKTMNTLLTQVITDHAVTRNDVEHLQADVAELKSLRAKR
jgi:hypothetical protein